MDVEFDAPFDRKVSNRQPPPPREVMNVAPPRGHAADATRAQASLILRLPSSFEPSLLEPKWLWMLGPLRSSVSGQLQTLGLVLSIHVLESHRNSRRNAPLERSWAAPPHRPSLFRFPHSSFFHHLRPSSSPSPFPLIPAILAALLGATSDSVSPGKASAPATFFA